MEEEFEKFRQQITEINLQLREYKAGFKIIQIILSAFGACLLTSAFVIGCRAVDVQTQTKVDTIKILALDKQLVDISQRIDVALVQANARWDQNSKTVNELKDELRKHWASQNP